MITDQLYAIAFPIMFWNENGSTIIESSTDTYGGYTRGGIALKQHPEITKAQLDAMTSTDFLNWYKTNYWLYYKCNLLPGAVAIMCFDACVNQGGEGIACMQRACNYNLTIDGDIGPLTLEEVSRWNPIDLTIGTATQRVLSYMKDPTWGLDGVGFLNRINRTLYKIAAALPSG